MRSCNCRRCRCLISVFRDRPRTLARSRPLKRAARLQSGRALAGAPPESWRRKSIDCGLKSTEFLAEGFGTPPQKSTEVESTHSSQRALEHLRLRIPRCSLAAEVVPHLLMHAAPLPLESSMPGEVTNSFMCSALRTFNVTMTLWGRSVRGSSMGSGSPAPKTGVVESDLFRDRRSCSKCSWAGLHDTLMAVRIVR